MQPGGVSPGKYILFDILVGSIVIKFVNIFFCKASPKSLKWLWRTHATVPVKLIFSGTGCSKAG